MGEHVDIFEVGPRDGLQNEPGIIPAADKIALIDRLSCCGFSRIEVASFVSPKRVPQMADGAEVLAGIRRAQDVAYCALTPNMQGYQGAIAANADEIAIFASASEAFSKANINCTIDESLERFTPVAQAARAIRKPMRGYVSCVTDCPYEGPVDPAATARVAEALARLGCYGISLGDTIGKGTPETISGMLEAVLDVVPARRLAGHYHDTGGTALDNIAVSLDLGLRVFDAAVAGLGGCPYAPGAPGNVATDAVVSLVGRRGFETGIDIFRLARATEFAKRFTHG
ncbi:MAG: hydroxymethylglutaryl-CoA lyase [Rhodobacteraceae bacterium]|nr:hydroxymethylglutaryl-CoA lyase [Paracoccaceae bacterium]